MVRRGIVLMCSVILLVGLALLGRTFLGGDSKLSPSKHLVDQEGMTPVWRGELAEHDVVIHEISIQKEGSDSWSLEIVVTSTADSPVLLGVEAQLWAPGSASVACDIFELAPRSENAVQLNVVPVDFQHFELSILVKKMESRGFYRQGGVQFLPPSEGEELFKRKFAL